MCDHVSHLGSVIRTLFFTDSSTGSTQVAVYAKLSCLGFCPHQTMWRHHLHTLQIKVTMILCLFLNTVQKDILWSLSPCFVWSPPTYLCLIFSYSPVHCVWFTDPQEMGSLEWLPQNILSLSTSMLVPSFCILKPN